MVDEDRGKSLLALLAVGLTIVSAACGESSLTPATTCEPQNQACTNPAAGTYQTCSYANGTVDYQTPNELCTCVQGNPTQCLVCAEVVTGYCGSDPTGGFTDAGSSNCTATFSGAFTGTSSSCVMSILYAPSANATSVRVRAAPVTASPYTWGAEFVASGTLATGTLQQTQGIEGLIFVTDESPGMLPNWEASINSGTPVGDATLQLTSMGPAVQADGQTFYQGAQGTWTGTLVDQRSYAPPQPNVTVTITF